jgi:ankyrin repeat protein
LKDDDGWTPLFFGASSGHEAIVQLLLQKGADLESKDETGGTPLFQAAENGHEAVVKLLLDERADIELKDRQGECSLDIYLVIEEVLR